MRGIILAGGNGTRLLPLTKVTNKHLLPVYKKVMIEYPLQTLIDLGCDDILIVTGGEHIGAFASYLGDGGRYGVRLTYRVQPEAGGVAQALLCAEGFTNEYELFPVILGDNYFEKPVKLDRPGIIVTKVKNPHRFGVYDPKTHTITEKPEKPVSKLAVTGLYWYDPKIYSYLKRLQKSDRGEYEISEANNFVLDNGGIVVETKGHWTDMGTHDSLLSVVIHESYNKELYTEDVK